MMAYSNNPFPKRSNESEKPNEAELDEYQERREKLHDLTQETRFNIIQTILMHPKQLPSLEEVVFMHPDRSRATLREHLEKLREMDVVRKVELPKDQRSRDTPKVFYGLTDEGRAMLEEFGLLDIEDTLQYLYQNMKKPDRIRKYEEAPRPDV
jgi:DNA-binding HxlR family transcriptional regulator